MGIYDSIKGAGMGLGTQMGGNPNAMGQGFAQQKPFAPSGNRPMQMANQMGMKPRPNPTMGQIPGQMGSRSMIQQKAAQQPAMGAPMGVNPVQSLQQNLSKQKGLQTPYDMQQAQPMQQPAMRQEQPPDIQQRIQAAPVGAGDLYGQMTPEQIQQRHTQLMAGQVSPQGPWAGGARMGRPDVMRPDYGQPMMGLGPSNPMEMVGGQPMQEMQPQQPVIMDENGLEPRRGPR